jgi:hypothetical protein
MAKPETKTETEALPDGHVSVRITKFGAGRVSTGVHIIGVGDVTWGAGDIVALPDRIAAELEKRGFAEIQ